MTAEAGKVRGSAGQIAQRVTEVVVCVGVVVLAFGRAAAARVFFDEVTRVLRTYE